MLLGGDVIKEWAASDPDWEDDFLMVDDFTEADKGKFNPKQLK
jgi:hypothetical protein